MGKEKKESKSTEMKKPDNVAEKALDEQPEGKHFNEGIEPKPSAAEAQAEAAEEEEQEHLGATEDEVTPVTAPEIVHDQSEEEEELLDEYKEDMTGGG